MQAWILSITAPVDHLAAGARAVRDEHRWRIALLTLKPKQLTVRVLGFDNVTTIPQLFRRKAHV
ncbi:MAG: hypothetical protein ACREUX_14610, partial [Burkholderiales bacterium]